MELYYSDKEKIQFLKDIGYIIEDIQTWDTRSEYHNQVSTEYYTTKIAYKEGDDISEYKGEGYKSNRYHVVNDIGYEAVFRKEFQDRLLKILI